MRRFMSVLFAALLALAAVPPGGVLTPRPTLAATATTTSMAPLLADPSAQGGVVLILEAGTVVKVLGPPQGDFVPVAVSGASGWIPATVLIDGGELQGPAPSDASGASNTSDAPGGSFDAGGRDRQGDRDERKEKEKGNRGEVVVEADGEPAAAEADAVPAPADEPAAAEEAASDEAASEETAPAAATAPVEPSAEPSTGGDEPIAAAEPGATADAAVAAEPAATAEATRERERRAERAPATLAPFESTATPASTATPIPTLAAASATVTPTPTHAASATPVPPATATPLPSPSATPYPAPTGPATVSTDANLRGAPRTDAWVVFTVPAGSTVEQTGQRQNGFVSATYMWMDGWLPESVLDEPAPVATEVPTATPPAELNIRTPRPGSGVAFTEVELSLRAGPSANEPALTTVPAGSRVVMTGVMENGFHRVTYQDQVGWIASDYLSTPPDPTPETGRRSEPRTYSREQITRIIYAAADKYGQSRQDMLRVATCESNLDPYAVNPSGSYGLYQFIRSTWRSTPYGGEDIFDPQANANAAGWMWQQGRKSEWVCK